MSAISVVALALSACGLLAGVVYFFRSWLGARVEAASATADDKASRDHVAAMETAEATARAQREAKFDAQAAAVRTAGDAAKLLRDVSDDPKTS